MSVYDRAQVQVSESIHFTSACDCILGRKKNGGGGERSYGKGRGEGEEEVVGW